jgi:hypothetical protein
VKKEGGRIEQLWAGPSSSVSFIITHEIPGKMQFSLSSLDSIIIIGTFEWKIN